MLAAQDDNIRLEIVCACGFADTIAITPADRTALIKAIFMGREYSTETGSSENSKRKFVLKPKKS